MSGARVVAVARDGTHRFSKQPVPAIEVQAGLGVLGDAHAGVTVKHRSRVARDPSQPNLRQVHLFSAEGLDKLARAGCAVPPAALGENVLTQGIDLLSLPRDAVLCLGDSVRLRVTGLRNPCAQIEAYCPGLLAQLLERRDGLLIRKAGIMSIVLRGGTVRPGDAIAVEMPNGPQHPLEPV